MTDTGRKWLEQQLPGFEDDPLWKDLAIVVSVPLEYRPGLTNVITVRRIDHMNYLDMAKRTCVLDTNTGLHLATLPASLEDAIEEYQQQIFREAHPFM